MARESRSDRVVVFLSKDDSVKAYEQLLAVIDEDLEPDDDDNESTPRE